MRSSTRQHRNFLEVTFLRRREVVIHNDDVNLCASHQLTQLFGLALAEVSRHIRTLTLAGEHGTRVGAGGLHEQAELLEFRNRIETWQPQLHQQGAFA